MGLQICGQTLPTASRPRLRLAVFGVANPATAHRCHSRQRPSARSCPRHPGRLSTIPAWLSTPARTCCRAKDCRWQPFCQQRVKASQQQSSESQHSPEQHASISSWQRMLAFGAVLTAGLLASNRQAHAMARYSHCIHECMQHPCHYKT